MQSIRVRFSRSMVTISSVILAVAFLMVVVAGGTVDGAVYQRHLLLSAVTAQIQRLQDVLTHPRTTLDLMAAMAEHPEIVRPWCAELHGHELPVVSPDVYQQIMRLAHWLEELTPTQRYLVAHNSDTAVWLLALSTPAQVAEFISTAATLRGTRLPLAPGQLATIAAAMPRVRETMEQLALCEQLRLHLVDKAGGVDGVLERMRHGAVIDAHVLPLDQILPPLTSATRRRLQRQLTIDHTRSAVMHVIDQVNHTDWSLLSRSDVIDWPLLCSQLQNQLADEGGSPARRLRWASSDPAPFTTTALTRAASMPLAQDALLASLNSALLNSQLYEEGAWNGYTLDPQATRLLKQDRARLTERQLTRLNRLLFKAAAAQAVLDSPIQPVFGLAVVARMDQSHTPAVARVHALLVAEVGVTALRDLRTDLRSRAQQDTLARTFVTMGYDATRGNDRSFWLIVLALLVCTVGIINSMTIAISERFRDIATMKCLGAPDSFIVSSFLSEAAILGLFGASLGVLIGIAFVLTQERLRFGSFVWSALPLHHLAYASACAMGCGLALTIIGALLPARYAARMHPIEAMRVET